VAIIPPFCQQPGGQAVLSDGGFLGKKGEKEAARQRHLLG
jgi:hypothetical protein